MTWKVQEEDCLWKIAQRLYSKGEDWEKIYQVNKDQIKNPDLIYPGQKLRIPIPKEQILIDDVPFSGFLLENENLKKKKAELQAKIEKLKEAKKEVKSEKTRPADWKAMTMGTFVLSIALIVLLLYTAKIIDQRDKLKKELQKRTL